MSATIMVRQIEATINDEMEWLSQDAVFQRLLNAGMIGWEVRGSDPNPPFTAAMDAAKRYGGKVIKYDELDYDPEVIY